MSAVLCEPGSNTVEEVISNDGRVLSDAEMVRLLIGEARLAESIASQTAETAAEPLTKSERGRLVAPARVAVYTLRI